MRKHTLLLSMMMICAAISLSGCKKEEEVDLTGIHTTAAETMAAETTAAAETEEAVKPTEAKKEKETEKDNAAEALSIRTKIATIKENQISIEYPILSNIRDEKTEEAVNELIKETASRIITDKKLDPETDNLTIACDIISLDRSNAVFSFQGSMKPADAEEPTSLFYTMTVDLGTAALQGLNDYADAYTMAGYILSDDCVITKAKDKTGTAEYLDSLEIEPLYETLKKCDFTSVKAGTFPESFSYVNQGIVYLTIPVPHELGDHITIEFHPETK